jgi:acylphosphatase
MAERTRTVSRRFFVRGRVQGVYYRAFVQKHANQLGLKGYTRNLADGRVEVYATGTFSELDALKGYLWKGPPLADVRGVDEQESAPEKVSGFMITG